MIKIFGLVITTDKKYSESVSSAFKSGWDKSAKCAIKTVWAAINPVIHDLEKLRANTWDQDKITHIQQWLKDNFEVKND